jgi:hypothetical protein
VTWELARQLGVLRSDGDAQIKNQMGLPNTELRLERNVKATWALILTLIVNTCCSMLAEAQSPNLIGRWNVEITLGNDEHRSLRFEAQSEGKATFELLDPRAKVWGAATSSKAKWSRGEGNAVTFSGPVEFLLGNIGRDAGTLVCKGKFETADLITGEVEFSPSVGERPSKHGAFKASRAKE